MQTRNTLARAAALAILVPMLSTLSVTASAEESRPAAPSSADQPQRAFQKLGQHLAQRGSGFGKQTIKRLKSIGERVANHMIARPEDLGDLDEIAASVVDETPDMLADEARRMKHDAMSDAVSETVATVKRAGN